MSDITIRPDDIGTPDVSIKVNVAGGMDGVGIEDITITGGAETDNDGPGGGTGGIAQETDPTVPAWAKEPEKPTYTAEEVGARPADWKPTPQEIGAQPAGNYALKSEIPSVPVQSVNGKTGAVQLNADDVGAASKERVEQLSAEMANNIKIDLTSAQSESCKTFAALFANTTGKADSFLFFTDPHTVHRSDVLKPRFDNYLDQIAAVYNSTPTSMCVCGGDWLNDSNTKDNACYVLGKIDGAMKKRFEKYVLIVGNHDTNYQGYEYMQSGADGTYDREELVKCKLSNEAIRNLWYREQGAAYFKIDCDTATYYVFDTGIDWYPEMDEYRWEQIDWFAKSLLTDKPKRCAVLLHIATDMNSVTPFANAISQVAAAYNSQSALMINDITYDFADAYGIVGFVLAGHVHVDQSFVHNNIPFISTTNLQAVSEYPSFDLVLVDWDGGAVHLVRVGDGDNRLVGLAEAFTNLFTYGISNEDWHQQEVGAGVDGLVVNNLEGYIQRADSSGGASYAFRNTQFINDGSTFKITANSEAVDANYKSAARLLLRAFDADGNVIQSNINGIGNYKSFYKSCVYDPEFGDAPTSEALPNITPSLNLEFTLPENVHSFQIGFVFKEEFGTVGVQIRISNITLTKV